MPTSARPTHYPVIRRGRRPRRPAPPHLLLHLRRGGRLCPPGLVQISLSSVGRGALTPPHRACTALSGRAHGPCPTKTVVGRDPCVPPHTALLAMCHCEASAHTGRGNPHPQSLPCARGNRRSAASGGCSKAISRKCPDWRARQCPGIGWHNGGQGGAKRPGRVVLPAPSQLSTFLFHLSSYITSSRTAGPGGPAAPHTAPQCPPTCSPGRS